ncbi:MAG: hypothetical protein FWD22_00055 [Treponema sp.]|nr:hypothetical protein [Treponema sp.]
MPTAIIFLVIFLLFPGICLQAESFRTSVEAIVEISPGAAEVVVPLGINSSVILDLGADARFLRGIELEISAPQSWLPYRGSLVMIMYNNLNPQNASGLTDMDGSRIAFEPLPSRLRIVYHIPLRQQHGLRTTTSVIMPTGVVQPVSFPIMFRLMQVSKGLPDDFDNTIFTLIARPILSDEGAVRLIPRFPPNLRNRPFTVIINDNVITNISDQILLREGEHHLVILSEDYRNESRRFVVERAKVIDLTIDLQDPTPIIIFEGPQNAQIFLNNTQISRNREPVTVEPGMHEVKFQVGDYTVIRSINVQRGKTYRVALAVDLTVQEED